MTADGNCTKGNNTEEKDSAIPIHIFRRVKEFPFWLTVDSLAEFIYKNIKPYEDTLNDTRKAVNMALDPTRAEGDFILVAEENQKPVGALIMLRTGMMGFIPENILLMVCIHPSVRGRGIGGRIIRKGLETAEGNVKLHVEYDNPAKQIYEKIGFTTQYAEMRYHK